jgi:hypothetical protein
MPAFYVDFDCIASSWMRTITILPADSDEGCIINVRAPPDWKDICFKQLRKNIYHDAYIADWSIEEESDVVQDSWLDCMCEFIDQEKDTVYLNNDRKCAIMEQFGFKKCINKHRQDV